MGGYGNIQFSDIKKTKLKYSHASLQEEAMKMIKMMLTFLIYLFYINININLQN